MSNPTSNFNWQMPTATDLVTDLPGDFEVFGQAVDTSLADLKGGTTGQVLSKTTNTDMDFSWVTPTTGMTNPMTTTGDTIYSSSGSTPARLGIGSTGQIMTVSGGVPTWATPAGGGKILQVVQGTTTTETTISSTTMTDTTITATITPTLSTSKVLIMISYAAGMYNGSENSRSYGGRIMRGATQIFDRQAPGVGYVDDVLASGSHSGHGVGISGAMVYLDSPATTSATTYKLQAKISATGSGGVGITFQGNNAVGSIILMEVGV